MTRLEVSLSVRQRGCAGWRSPYASGEKVGSEYEAMDPQLTANLVDAKLVHARRTYESAMRTSVTYTASLHEIRFAYPLHHPLRQRELAWLLLVSAFGLTLSPKKKSCIKASISPVSWR